MFELDPKLKEKHQILDWGYVDKSTPMSFERYHTWVEANRHGSLGYLADERKLLREDLTKIYPEFQSALVFLFDYSSAKKTLMHKAPLFKLASYIFGTEGKDYHDVLKTRLEHLARDLNINDYMIAIDTKAILERDLAYRAGLGWFGKNSMLINPKHGSYFLIASMLLPHKLEIVKQVSFETDHCGHCRACIDACPTKAIIENERVLDASLCISTFTIELFKDAPPPKGYSETQEIFGCDICQEVCPWNIKPIKGAPEIDLKNDELFNFFNRPKTQIIEELNTFSNRSYQKKMLGTPLFRTGLKGMLKNFLYKKD